MKSVGHIAVLVAAVLLAGNLRAAEVTVAVASNFLDTAQRLTARFEAQTGHQVRLVNGATGALFAQIHSGAPYDLFLSADVARVARLEAEGMLAGAGRKPYALGQLVLYARRAPALGPDVAGSLRAETTRHFAMADPALAPYGRAAEEVLAALDPDGLIAGKAVIGTNVGQAHAFVATGNAEMGFVALAQVIDADGVWIVVPATLYAPIVQEAGLLARAEANPGARALFDYLTGPEAQAIITRSGYGGVP